MQFHRRVVVDEAFGQKKIPIDGQPSCRQPIAEGRKPSCGFTLVELPFGKLRTAQPSKRIAFTLVELLVVIAIIGVLVALLLPAVQAAREAARRSSCINNLKQYGIGLSLYEGTHKTYPIGAFARYYSRNNPGFGHSFQVPLFGFMEQQALYDTLDSGMGGPGNGWNDTPSTAHYGSLYMLSHDLQAPAYGFCPSTDLDLAGAWGPMICYTGIAGAVEAVIASDGALLFDPTDFEQYNFVNGGDFANRYGPMASNGMLVGGGDAIAISQCTDGTSNTLVMAERSTKMIDANGVFWNITGTGSNGHSLLYGGVFNGTVPNAEAPIHLFSRSYNITSVRYSINETYNAAGAAGMSPGGHNQPLNSAHPGGVNSLRTDGSVSFLPETIELLTLKRLAARNDGGTTTLD